MLTPFIILVVIALLLAIIGLIWPTYPVVAVAVVQRGAVMATAPTGAMRI